MKLRINKITLPVIILTLTLIISSLFQIAGLKYTDEIIAFVSIGYFAYKLTGNDLDRISFVTLSFVLIMLIIGLTANVNYQYQQGWKPVFQDIFLFFKPYFIFAAFYLFFNKRDRIKNYNSFVMSLAKVLSVLLVAGLVIGYIFDIPSIAFWSSWVPFKFIKTYVFYSGYPGYLAVFTSAIIMVLLTEAESRKNRSYIYLNVLVLICTQSGLAYIAVFLLVVFVFIFKGKKIQWYHIAFLVGGGILVGWNEISWYLMKSTAARSIMLKYGFITAKNCFPLGSGFSTYGGTIAQRYYSKLYNKYMFGMYWGMGQNRDVDFMHDFYYPVIIGQFGFIGTFAYLWYEFSIYKLINSLRNQKYCRCALLFGFVLILVMNLGQGEFGGCLGAIFMIFMPFILRKAEFRNAGAKETEECF